MNCPGCSGSYCIDCGERVHRHVFRCEPCRVEFDERDPFAQAAREADKLAEAWKAAAEALEIAYIGEPTVGELPLMDYARALGKETQS